MSATPEVWVGLKNGVAVAEYPNRWVAESALVNRRVDSISPKNWGQK